GNSGSSDFGYAMLAIVGTVFYAISALIIQSKLKNIPSLQLSAGIFALILPLGIVSLWMSGFFSAFNGSHDQWVGMGYIAILSLVGTALAAGLFFRLIQMSSAVFAGAVTYLIPVVAAMWGAVDGEHITVSYIL